MTELIHTTCRYVVDELTTSATRRPHRCGKPATAVVAAYGRLENDYCERHARLVERDQDGVRR